MADIGAAVGREESVVCRYELGQYTPDARVLASWLALLGLDPRRVFPKRPAPRRDPS